MTEADLWAKFHAALRAEGGFGVRLESRTGLGIPDAQAGIERHGAWIENKIAFGNARPQVEGPQAGFGVRAHYAGTRAVCMAARSSTRVAIWPLWLFADLIVDHAPMPEPEWEGPIAEAPAAIIFGGTA